MNTKFYHAVLKARKNANRVFSVKDDQGIVQTEPTKIANAVISYYKRLLGENTMDKMRVCAAIINMGPKVREEHKIMLNAEFTTNEVKQAMRSIVEIKHYDLMDIVSNSLKIHGTLWGLIWYKVCCNSLLLEEYKKG